MKTKDLIKLLKEADPTGEEEVCIDNNPVWFVQRMPAYYDGRLVRFEPPLPIDEDEGMRVPDKVHFVSDGAKVEIMYYTWRSAMWDSDGELELGNYSEGSDIVDIVEEERKKVLDFMSGKEERLKTLKDIREKKDELSMGK